MTEKPKWGIGSEQYKKRPGAGSSPARLHQQGAKAPLPLGYQLLGDTGRVSWERGEVDLELITHSSVERTVFRFERALPDFIWNAAALEGNTFTLPEVRTLLDGVTVGGRPIGDAQQILNLSEALNLMTEQVRNGSFRLNQETSDQINAIVARNEIIEPGVIWGTGYVHVC